MLSTFISIRKPRRFSTPASLSFKGQATEPDLNAATLCSFIFYPELHSFTPKDISKKNAGYKRNQVYVWLLLLFNQICLPEMRNYFFMSYPVFEEDEETLAWKSITAKEEKPQEAVFSISERSLTPPV